MGLGVREAGRSRSEAVIAMITRLKLGDFKSFVSSEIELGPLTVVVGSNAGGKSNMRDAFRFLHGIGRGYTLAEILGGKWGESGAPVWRGIRGGVRELIFRRGAELAGWEAMTLEVDFVEEGVHGTYKIGVGVWELGDVLTPQLAYERLSIEGVGEMYKVLDVSNDPGHIRVQFHAGARPRVRDFVDDRPLLGQIIGHPLTSRPVRQYCMAARDALASMRFLDLVPEAMRSPSTPGQKILSDRGENLSSVLQSITRDERTAATLLQWLRELTPQDVQSLEFTSDTEGRILLNLVEAEGRKISAHSASDGTLRFLAILAAVFSPEPASLYFFEELENGVHPTRLHLLAQVLEQQTQLGGAQVIATTHSPVLLSYLNNTSLQSATLVYRKTDGGESIIKRLVDVPNFVDAQERVGVANLHESGWFETIVHALEGEEQ